MEGTSKPIDQILVVPDSDSEDGNLPRLVMVQVRDCRDDDGDDDFTNDHYEYEEFDDDDEHICNPSLAPPATTTTPLPCPPSPKTPPAIKFSRPPSPKTPPAMKRMLPSVSPSPLPRRQRTRIADVEKQVKKARVSPVVDFKEKVDLVKEKLRFSMTGRDPWQPPYPYALLTGKELAKAKQDYHRWVRESKITIWQEGHSQPCPA